MNNLALCESQSLREEQIKGLSQDKALETLDKAKALVMAIHHGTGVATTEHVGEYFEVSVKTIESVVRRHRDELNSDGFKVLKGKDLKELLSSGSVRTTEPEKTTVLTAWTPRSMLRCGMLLRDSEVAKQVRNVLLDIAGQKVNSEYPKQITGNIPIDPSAELAAKVDSIFDTLFKLVEPEIRTGMKIEAMCNVDPTLRPMLEPFKPKLLLESPLLSPTDIGKLLEAKDGIKRSGQAINKLLTEKNLQVATGDKKLAYRAKDFAQQCALSNDDANTLIDALIEGKVLERYVFQGENWVRSTIKTSNQNN